MGNGYSEKHMQTRDLTTWEEGGFQGRMGYFQGLQKDLKVFGSTAAYMITMCDKIIREVEGKARISLTKCSWFPASFYTCVFWVLFLFVCLF